MGDSERLRIQRELETVAFGDARSGREADAKVRALKTLERQNRPSRNGSYPVDDDGRFNPLPAEAWDLYRWDSDETRERWRVAWEGQRWRFRQR